MRALTLTVPSIALPGSEAGEGVEMTLVELLYKDAIRLPDGREVFRVATWGAIAGESGVLLSLQETSEPYARHYFIPLAELFHGNLHDYTGTTCRCGHDHAIAPDLVEERWAKLVEDGWTVQTVEGPPLASVQVAATEPQDGGMTYHGRGPTLRAAKFDLYRKFPKDPAV